MNIDLFEGYGQSVNAQAGCRWVYISSMSFLIGKRFVVTEAQTITALRRRKLGTVWDEGTAMSRSRHSGNLWNEPVVVTDCTYLCHLFQLLRMLGHLLTW